MLKYVSLGSNCSVSYQLKKIGLRKEAYPFDWCSTNYKNLLEVLKNDFKDYEKVSIKKFSLNHHPHGIDDKIDDNLGTYILRNSYGITFAHEITEENEENIKKFEEIIIRRIERFRKLRDSKIIFIRIEINDKIDNYDDLLITLDKNFSDYKLIILGNNNYEKLNKEKIEYYKLPEFRDWKYDNFDWNNLLNKI